MHSPGCRSRRRPSCFLNHTPRSFETVHRDCCISIATVSVDRPQLQLRPNPSLGWAMSSTDHSRTRDANCGPRSENYEPFPHSNSNSQTTSVPKAKSSHIGMAAAAEMLYPQLPLNNPSFDMAYFLKNTGPSRRQAESTEHPDAESPKQRGPLKFLRSGGRRIGSIGE